MGGVEINHDRGLIGHSDADCLIHALADSMFGALALPDIGHHFPDNDPTCKDMDSQIILEKAAKESSGNGNKEEEEVADTKPKREAATLRAGQPGLPRGRGAT